MESLLQINTLCFDRNKEGWKILMIIKYNASDNNVDKIYYGLKMCNSLTFYSHYCLSSIMVHSIDSFRINHFSLPYFANSQLHCTKDAYCILCLTNFLSSLHHIGTHNHYCVGLHHNGFNLAISFRQAVW